MEICGLLCQQAGECAVLLSELNESRLLGESRSELHEGAGSRCRVLCRLGGLSVPGTMGSSQAMAP